MAFDFIKPDNLNQQYDDAKKFMLPLFDPFDEFERIARNKPHPGIAKNLPKVTDGTLAALIQEQPKRVIQQIPTGKVESTSKWIDIIATYILEHEIIPNANMQAALIQKCWALISKCLTYGSQPTFVQFVNKGQYFGTDFTLPYIKDVFLEPGKLSDTDSNIMFLRTWWTENQIDAVIAREDMLKDRAKERGETYEMTWDKTLLRKLKSKAGQKDVNAMSPNEKGKQLNEGFIEIVHGFQQGIGAKFYSFSPQLPGGKNIVRTRVNKDPRGVIPINYMYSNVDMSNPLGRGGVEISGGMQNLLDSEVQSYQYMRSLLMNPPIEKRGNFSKSTMKYEPGAIWDMGVDPNASVKPVSLSTDSLTSFPNNYGLIKSQILNLNSSTDTSVSSEVGNPGFSKTPAGVNMQETRLGISDNYIRRQFESVWSDIAETMINLYFAERSGTQELTLDEDTANKLKEIAPEAVNENNQVQIDYESETEKLKFEVDPSTSSLKDNVAERDRLLELLDMTQKYPALGQIIGEKGTKELVNRIVIKTGVEDPEKIMPSDEEQIDPATGQPIQQQPEQPPSLQPEQVQQMIDQALEQEKQKEDQNDPKRNPVIQMMDALKIKFTDLPEDSQHTVLDEIGLGSNQNTPTARELNMKGADTAVSMHNAVKESENMQENTQEGGQEEPGQELDQTDQQIIQQLGQRGYTKEQIDSVIQMMKQGIPNEQIIQSLHGGQQ